VQEMMFCVLSTEVDTME